ncbi:cell wall-binding repeat-containing protein [Ornithinimicrobium pratense]|uniref:Cell wall-binding repeat-containing protein n=1 Tax=Ornithinimicrobium pratense TaxID=2593973 RepID=A0A5J6V970_9MICO|nr:cell wall-binding repeat-containing protein [Ornithinimicrobium pratense]QFG69663.1 cell wall-binding repeat-containing protein [Ornithinimicrobium pratense]
MRSLTTSLAVILLVATGSAPTTRGDSAPSAGESVVVAEEGRLPALTREDAEAIRLHAARALAAQPSRTAYLDSHSQSSSGFVHPVVTRHSGSDRYATAAALAIARWRDVIWADVDGVPYPHDRVILIASGQDFPDALSGGALAAYYGGPMLLTRKDSLPGATRTALAALDPDYIAVLGGTNAVSDAVVRELAQYVAGSRRVVRYGGKDRYEVSATMARDIFGGGFGQRAYVALGTNWPDGLAGAATAGSDWAPLLLTRKDGVPGVVMQTLARARPEEIVLLGGPAAVNDTVVMQLGTVAPVVRVGGADRYAVAANAAGLDPTRFGATIASGQNWPDALSGSAYAGLVGDKLLLVRSNGVPGATQQAVRAGSLALIDAVGGRTTLPEPVLNQLRSLRVRTPG